ncbi:MAG: hypothetical protein J5780_03660 [Treponema sp.]|nr:hypothetical protein [Treponema sp.]
MKMLKKICTVIAALSLAFGLASCTNIQEDEDLIISIEQDGTVVTLTAPSEYEGNNFKVFIIYTLDGTEPSVSNFNSEAYAANNGADKGEPDNWVSKNGEICKGLVVVDFGTGDSVTIKAKGFYVDESDPTSLALMTGPVASKVLTKPSVSGSSAQTPAADGQKSGKFTFNLTDTGNSNTTHYFDTSKTNIFKFNDDYPNVYYQTQFSWKGNGKGNWYLYMRDVNKGLIKNNASAAFVAKGTYTGACFDSSSGAVTAGELTLLNEAGTETDKVTVTTGDKAFFSATVFNSISTVASGSIFEGTAGFQK